MNITHQPRLSFFHLLLLRIHPNLALMLRFSAISKNFIGVRQIIMLALVTAGRDLRVLLADDDADDRDFFIDAVTEVAPRVKVETVFNGDQLMMRLSDGLPMPDIIFLDLNMPVKDGHECLEEIRSDERLRHIPIIIYSTSSSREHIDETYENGASLYIRKPDSFKDLKTIAQKLFSLNWDNHTRPAKEKYYFTAKTF